MGEPKRDRMREIVDALAAIDYPGPVTTDDFYGDPVVCALCEATSHVVDDPERGYLYNKPGRAWYYRVIDHNDSCPWVQARQIRNKPHEWVPPWEQVSSL